MFTMTNLTTCGLAVWLNMDEYYNDKFVILAKYQPNAKLFLYHTESGKDYDYIDRIVTTECVLSDFSVFEGENIRMEFRGLYGVDSQHRVETMNQFIQKYHHRRHIFSHDFVYKLNVVYNMNLDDQDNITGMCSTFTGLYYDMLTDSQYPWNLSGDDVEISAFRLLPIDYHPSKLKTQLFEDDLHVFYRHGDVPIAGWMNLYLIIFVIMCLIILLVATFILGWTQSYRKVESTLRPIFLYN
jgi:hypothetical protein